MKSELTQVWELKVRFQDEGGDNEKRRLLRRDLVSVGIKEHMQDAWRPVEVEMTLKDEGVRMQYSVEDLEAQALNIVSDTLQDNDELIRVIGDITTRVQAGYDARTVEVADNDDDPRYDAWYSTYSNVQNRIMAKFMHNQFYPRDFTPRDPGNKS